MRELAIGIATVAPLFVAKELGALTLASVAVLAGACLVSVAIVFSHWDD